MPSFRIVVTPGMLRAGVAPEGVIPAASDAVAQLTTVESADIMVVERTPRIVVRFTADDAELAEQIAEHAAAVLGTAVEVRAWWLFLRDGGRWTRVA